MKNQEKIAEKKDFRFSYVENTCRLTQESLNVFLDEVKLNDAKLKKMLATVVLHRQVNEK